MSLVRNPKVLLLLICILFLFTRLYKIASIPVSVYWDEASIGYNAYSISQTGKDEWGEFLPLHFRAFGEFKLPTYIYSVALFVKILGLTALAIRLPSVLFSLGVILLTYLLAKEFTKNTVIGLFSSLFVSISPWFFIFSRTGYEATAGLMFYLLGIYLFLFIAKRNLYLVLSTISFVISAYSYNSFRVIIPITFFLLSILSFNNLRSINKKQVTLIIISMLIFFLSIIPIYKLYRFDSGLTRFQAIGNLETWSIAKNYLSHFSLDFLLSGDKNMRSQQSSMGQIYLFDFILILFGFIYMSKKISNYSLVLFFLLISPIPAAITKESPHALRSISAVPFLCMILAIGAFYIKTLFKNQYLGYAAVIIIPLLFFSNYLNIFLNVYPIQSSKEWQYGYKNIYLNYQDQLLVGRNFISDEYGQPYIFALFYLKYDPEKFQKNAIRNDMSDWGFSTVSQFDNFRFGKVNTFLKYGNLDNNLIFASDKEEVANFIPFETVKFLDGSIAFKVFKL